MTDRKQGRIGGAALCSIAVHAATLGAILWFAYVHQQQTAREAAPQAPPQRIVWIAIPGPSGGGGGSKPITPPPPRPVPPQAARTIETPAPVPVPDVKAPEPEPQEPQPPAPAAIAETPNSGAANTVASAAGDGAGKGAGPGNGDGAGPGQDNGFGGGAYRPGNGVSTPIAIVRASPRYTVEAMRARAQGVITVECVVEPDGECGDVRIIRGFTPPYGLDQQAIATARAWRFRPGMRGGEPVPVLVNLEIEFNIR